MVLNIVNVNDKWEKGVKLGSIDRNIFGQENVEIDSYDQQNTPEEENRMVAGVTIRAPIKMYTLLANFYLGACMSQPNVLCIVLSLSST